MKKILCLLTFLIFSLNFSLASGKKDSVKNESESASENNNVAESNSQTETNENAENISEKAQNLQEKIIVNDEDLLGKKITLSKIDDLIKQTKYSEALALLAEYIRVNPDNFDAAKKRIDKIMSYRHDYNYVENNLIDLASNNPNEADKNYQMVLKLEKLEQKPSVIHETIRTEIKNLTQFKACQQRFTEIMKNASDDVAKKQYALAAEEFRKEENGKQSAFEIYKEDFVAENNPRKVTLAVDKALADVDSSITEFGAIQAELDTSYKKFIDAVEKRDYPEAESLLPGVVSSFTKLASIRNKAANAGWQIQQIYTDLNQGGSELTDASYLPFVSKFILGRGKDSTSGLVGTIDSQWNSYVETMKDGLYKAVLSYSENYGSSLSVDTLFNLPALHENGKDAIKSSKNYSGLALSINNLYDLIKTKNGSSILSEFAQYSNSMNFISNMYSKSQNLFEQIHAVALQVQSDSEKEQPQDIISSIRSKNNSYSSSIIKSTESYLTYGRNATTAKNEKWLEDYKKMFLSENNQNIEENKTVENIESKSEKKYECKNAFESYINAYSEIEKICSSQANMLWVKLASYFAEGSNSMAQGYNATLQNIATLVPENKTDENGKELYQYPTKCISEIEQMQSDISSDLKVLNSCNETLNSAGTYKAGFSDLSNQINSSIDKMNEIVANGNTLKEKSKVQKQNAKLAQNEGDLRYNQAKNALRNSNFDSARDYLQRARNKYSESLSYENNEELRKTSDTNLVALGEDISKAENEIVVKDVRDLKNRAKNAYYAGNFDEAETLLARAETRWAVTNIEADDEIVNLKTLVNTALSMKTGRVIPPTAPLYPEMSQILSIANQYYNDGQKLMKSGKKDEATEILNKAKSKLNELKLVYPLNQEASLLTLRIDQLLDKNSFDTMFTSKVEAARVNYKSNDATTKQQAYSDLVDLYEINPNYKGLKNLIYNVEIELGIRQKPVDNSSLVKAESLARQAKSIVNSAGRNAEKLQQAKQLALQAVALNPNNDMAITVLDEIALKTGGQAAVVLSAADEELYQKAVQELQKNNIIGANTIVLQLLEKPVNKRSAKILELQRKVQALL
ncbi:MAG: hypothetical protein WCQ67_09605 [Treponema sp.]